MARAAQMGFLAVLLAGGFLPGLVAATRVHLDDDLGAEEVTQAPYKCCKVRGRLEADNIAHVSYFKLSPLVLVCKQEHEKMDMLRRVVPFQNVCQAKTYAERRVPDRQLHQKHAEAGGGYDLSGAEVANPSFAGAKFVIGNIESDEKADTCADDTPWCRDGEFIKTYLAKWITEERKKLLCCDHVPHPADSSTSANTSSCHHLPRPQGCDRALCMEEVGLSLGSLWLPFGSLGTPWAPFGHLGFPWDAVPPPSELPTTQEVTWYDLFKTADALQLRMQQWKELAQYPNQLWRSANEKYCTLAQRMKIPYDELLAFQQMERAADTPPELVDDGLCSASTRPAASGPSA